MKLLLGFCTEAGKSSTGWWGAVRCVCVYTCACVHLSVGTHGFVCVHCKCMNIRVCASMWVCMHMGIAWVCTCVGMYERAHVWIRVVCMPPCRSTRVCVQACMCTHTHLEYWGGNEGEFLSRFPQAMQSPAVKVKGRASNKPK